ncbi:PAS domain S-box-containing protein/diguanylate cyclase (GGDEF) domain-containing protein [Carnobacterium iners]|uniref:PAS domain S-box-containing protein/diguanylate cyclase (GGDEF) domain-containing protein n=1 Tax=Carnobacterium iners TaxID=1073423 RepID=A0A1X7N9X4_9LACT|nr:sensor domain-containing diguanylate cyclase [Carnobacterium iners]SEL27175.1 PAS domain S-box-containing protein/diguanylate cyclase (GGDEF) domain-containing protein [Carnobacterium iners]SMH33434.1 PAS domain S-box-containing protein/diguanylate cyclase (GGDEF) domain-containing protein [Carnobacterium iners]
MKKITTKYSDLSKSQLIKLVEEMEETFYQISNDKNETELLSFPWIGNLGQWHWMVENNLLLFNEKKLTNLGYEREEIPEEVGFEFFTSKLHPDDYERVMEDMRKYLRHASDVYEVEYRIQTKDGNYIWYYDRGTITKENEDGEPLIISGIVFDITKRKVLEEELKESNEKLKQLVDIDELTGAFTRRYMLNKIENEIQRYNTEKLCFSLIMLDIDNFKLVNDNLGHNIGDTVLKDFVEIVEKPLRVKDSLSRWGGEEFLILLPATNLSDAVKIANEIRVGLNHTCMNDAGIVTASIGVSNYYEGDSTDNAIKRVDDLMYQAKYDDRNCIKY